MSERVGCCVCVCRVTTGGHGSTGVLQFFRAKGEFYLRNNTPQTARATGISEISSRRQRNPGSPLAGHSSRCRQQCARVWHDFISRAWIYMQKRSPSSVLSCSHRWHRASERTREYPFIRLWNVEQFLQRASPNPSVCIFAAKFICAGDEGGDKRRRNCLNDETAEPFFIWKGEKGSIISMTIYFSCCALVLGENTGNCFSYWKCKGI